MHVLIVFMVAALALLVGPVAAQPKWAMGQTYSGNIDLGGVQVPLLPGDWTVIATQAFASTSNATGGTGGDTRIVAFAQIIGNVVRAYVVLNYNQRSMSTGWNVSDSAQCRRQEIHHAKIVRERQLDKSCQYVNHVIHTVSASSAQWWKDSIEYARKNGITMPPVAIAAGAIVSDRANFIAANYYFNPAVVGFQRPQNTTWEQNDWNIFNVTDDEKKKAFIQSVIDWTEKTRLVVEAGLAGKLKKGESLDWPTAMQ